MSVPAFFDAVARITLHDPLAERFGAADNGRIEYGYVDAAWPADGARFKPEPSAPSPRSWSR